jgi:hypothetical protein
VTTFYTMAMKPLSFEGPLPVMAPLKNNLWSGLILPIYSEGESTSPKPVKIWVGFENTWGAYIVVDLVRRSTIEGDSFTLLL